MLMKVQVLQLKLDTARSRHHDYGSKIRILSRGCVLSYSFWSELCSKRRELRTGWGPAVDCVWMPEKCSGFGLQVLQKKEWAQWMVLLPRVFSCSVCPEGFSLAFWCSFVATDTISTFVPSAFHHKFLVNPWMVKTACRCCTKWVVGFVPLNSGRTAHSWNGFDQWVMTKENQQVGVGLWAGCR